MFVLFVYFFSFYLPHLFRNLTVDLNSGEVNPYLKRFEAKFQEDSLRGFGGRGIYNVINGYSVIRIDIIFFFVTQCHQLDLLWWADSRWALP